MRFLIFFLTSFFFFSGLSCVVQESSSSINELLLVDLLHMEELDQDIRKTIICSENLESFWTQVLEIDHQNTERCKEIISQFGWPGYNLVGIKGSHAMWILVQHSQDHEFQKSCLQLLEVAVKENDASVIDFAYLQDKILMHEGKPQIYGTQWSQMHGEKKLVLWQVKDFATLNKRRLALGLNTIEEYREFIFANYCHSQEEVETMEEILQKHATPALGKMKF